MFEAYKIGVRIGVVDATAGGIMKIASQFGKAHKEASGLLATINKINEAMRKTSAGWAEGVASGYERARRAADAYANSADRASRTGGYGGASGGGTGMMAMGAASAFVGSRAAGNQAMALGAPGGGMRALGGPSGASPSMLALGYGGGGRPPAGIAGGSMSGGGSGGSGNFAMAGNNSWAGWNNWGPGGGGGGGGNAPRPAASGMGGAGALLGGALIEHDGAAMFGMLRAPIEKAAEYQQQVAKFTLYGMGDQLNAEAVKFAGSMHVVGTSMTDAMRHMTEAQGIFRESGLTGSAALAGAKLAAPLLAKIDYATSGLDGDSQQKMHAQSLAMLRFVEMRGGLHDAGTFNGIADAGWKAIRSSGGNVNWEQLRQFMARGGVAAQGLDNKALFGMLEPVIGELKGSGAGTALMTSYNRLIGGVRVPNQVAHLLADNGIWDSKKITWNSQGGIKSFNGNPLKDMKTLSANPVEFYEKNILPMYAKLGITTAADKGRENLMIFGRTGGAMFSLIDRQLDAIHRSVDAQGKTKGIDDSVGIVKKTFAGQMLDYQAKMNDLQIQLGLVIIPNLTKALLWLNPKIQAAADWIGAHSTLTKGLVILFASVAGLAVVGGSILAIGGAFTMIAGVVAGGGGLAVALSGVGTALVFVAGAAAAMIAGAKAGGWIYDKGMSNNASGRGVGAAIAHTLAFFGNEESQAYVDLANGRGPVNHTGDFHGLPGSKVIQVNSAVHLDGKQVATVVTKHQVSAMGRPQTGMSGFDSSQGPAPIGATGSF